MSFIYFRNEKLNFKKYYYENIRALEQAKNSFLSIISSVLSEGNFEVYTMIGRIKAHDECIKKFTNKYRPQLEKEQVSYKIKDHINDLIGLRIIMLYETDIDKVGELLQKEFTVLDKTDKSKQLEKQENVFGYKGLHLDMKLSDDRIKMSEYRPFADFSFEIQIRTIIQDSWSVLDHKIKYKKVIPRHLERRINSLAALFEIADREFFEIHLASKKEEEKAKALSPKQENINAFTFYRLLVETMPDLLPEENHIEEFVDHILTYGDLSYDELKSMILTHQDKTRQYVASISDRLGKNFMPDALAYIIHILYLANPEIYKGLIPKFTEKDFNEWRTNNPLIEHRTIKKAKDSVDLPQ